MIEYVLPSVILAASGAILGLVPVVYPEGRRREALALAAYKRRGFRGSPRFPIRQWPPTGPLNLMTPSGFLPGNFQDDSRFPENQSLRYAIGRPEDVDKIGWDAAGELTLTDTRVASLSIVCIAASVIPTALGLLAT